MKLRRDCVSVPENRHSVTINRSKRVQVRDNLRFEVHCVLSYSRDKLIAATIQWVCCPQLDCSKRFYKLLWLKVNS